MTDTESPQVLERVVPPWISAGILQQGYYHLGGAVARAVDVAGLLPGELLDTWALHYDGSPFVDHPDHVDVLRFPVHPLMQLTTPAPTADRPWPTYPMGFLFGETVAPVWNLERTRVPVGAELWRCTADGEALLATFAGPAMGWQGASGYFPPIHFVGARAKWRDLDVPAELSRDRNSVELTVVGSSGPDGFEQVRPDVWRREVPRSEVEQFFELVLACTYRDLPCRILQHTAQQSRLLLLTDDSDDARRVGAEEADIGVFEVTAPTADLADVGGTTREMAAAS